MDIDLLKENIKSFILVLKRGEDVAAAYFHLSFILSLHFFMSRMYVSAMQSLRASLCKFQESGDKAEISNLFLFYQNSLFGDLFSKIA